MKSVKAIIFTFLFLFSLSSIGYAATMTISIAGLDATTPVEGWTVWYAVSSDFSYSNFEFGDAIPDAVGTLGWQPDLSIVNQEFHIAGSNFDLLLSSLNNPLGNGNLATFDYEGTISGITLASFFSGDLSPVEFYNNVTGPIKLERLSNSNTNFQGPAAIPIPGAIWLLGSGLIGIVAIRRKKAKVL